MLTAQGPAPQDWRQIRRLDEAVGTSQARLSAQPAPQGLGHTCRSKMACRRAQDVHVRQWLSAPRHVQCWCTVPKRECWRHTAHSGLTWHIPTDTGVLCTVS